MAKISAKQWMTLMRPLNSSRVAKRSQGGKQLSYLEAYDVRAHLIRIFGFTNFDAEMLEYHHVATREYMSSGDTPKPMVEVIYSCRMRLTVRDPEGDELGTYVEAAVGSTSGPANTLGDHHDNALKTAASDALKRCAINLGTQFGLSLYENGTTREIIKDTLVKPEGVEAKPEATEAQVEALQKSLGATVVSHEERPPVAPDSESEVKAPISEAGETMEGAVR